MDRAARTWHGDWRARVLARVKETGFSSVTDYLAHCPGVPYLEVARRLGEDVAARQVSRLQQAEADNDPALLRRAAMDALPRELNHHLPEGWRHGARGDFPTASAYASWASRFDLPESLFAAKFSATWDALESLSPSVGWKPAGPDDPLIVQAFEIGWPERPARKIPRAEVLFCPQCSAVLTLSPPDAREITCYHCKERIEIE